MLPYNNRLTKRKDFEAVYKDGQFASFGNIAIKMRQSGLKESRIGIVVGLKFSKRAVERNQIKRKIRDIVRKKLGKIKKGWDIVVMARRREGEKIDLRRMEEMIDKAFEKGQITN